MRNTLKLKAAALSAVKSLAQERSISVSDAASDLILMGAAAAKAKFKTRHGIPLARNDGVTMTAKEVAAMLSKE